MTIAMLVFSVTLFLILALFLLKQSEIRRGARFGERTRARADSGALVVKHWLAVGEWYVEQSPYFAGALVRYAVHVGALSFANVARTSAEYAHALADLVSHKHRFERRETKSQYLKQVAELRNRAAEPVITEPRVPDDLSPEPHTAESVAAPVQSKKRRSRHVVAEKQ